MDLKQAVASPAGETLINEIEKLAHRVKVDSDSPNGNAAIFKAGIFSVVQRLKKIQEAAQKGTNTIEVYNNE